MEASDGKTGEQKKRRKKRVRRRGVNRKGNEVGRRESFCVRACVSVCECVGGGRGRKW